MESNWGEPEPFQYMMEVNNGWVHGVEWSPDRDNYSRNDLQSEDKSPETILKASENHEYDFEHSDFTNDSISADKVGIDAVNGIIDVYKNDEVIDQYSLVGILEDDQGRPELVFAGFEYDDKGVVAKTGSEIEWSPNLAAAYEAVYNSIDFERDLEEESVPLYSEDKPESNITSLDAPSARQIIKRIDDFVEGINDPAEGIADFEDRGEIRITVKDHYGSARGYPAAQEVKTDLNRLKGAGLIEYTTEPLSNNGDEKEVDLKIAREFLDGKDCLSEDVDGLSDFDIEEHEGREELTDERMS